MAEMYVGTTAKVPVKNIASEHWGDLVGEISNQTDLQEALDSKVDEVSTPSVLYGTDSNGQQTTYDLSLLFDTETAPDGYTDVEYITSSDESTKSVRIRDYHAETSSFMGFEIVDAGKFMDYFNSILARRYDYPITCIKFQVENPSTSGAPMLWYVYVNAQGSTEPTMRNGGSVYEEPYDGMDSIEQRWGIRPIYSDTTSREEGDSGTFDIYEVSASGQYIDTGIEILKYNIGAVLYDEEHSTCANPDTTHTSAADSTDWYFFNGKKNNATASYGEEITQFRFKITAVESSDTFSVEVYANDKDVAYETFTNTTTNSLRGQYGVVISGDMTVDDEYVFYSVGRIQDTYAVETSVKLSDYQLTQSYNHIFGSVSQSGNSGCGVRCSENDGILFKHYLPNVQHGFAIPYNKGNWNNIKIEPAIFTLNGNSYSIDSGDIRTVSGKTFILFGTSVETGVNTSGMSMKKTKIYKNGNLVFNGIPCVEDSSGIAGMYDLVTQQFFKSAKEGAEFIAGPVKESSSETNLGIEGENVLVGLDKEGKISAYTGKNGVIIEGTIGIDDYEELEYIESVDGNLAFDTKRYWGEPGYSINSAKWEITYNQVKTSNPSHGNICQYVFGDGMFTDMGQSFYRIDFRFFRGYGAFPYTSTNGEKGAGADDGIFTETLDTWNTFAFDYKKLYLNNTAIKTLNYQISTSAHTKNFHIFNAPNAITSGEFGEGFIGKISKVTLTVDRGSSNVILANFVPVRRKSDNELGFYDTVNGIFSPNINSGTPIAGPIKKSTITLSRNLDNLLENMAYDQQSSLIISQYTDSNGNDKNLDKSVTSSVLIGPNVKTLNDGLSNDIIIEGTAQGSQSVAIGKYSIGGTNSVSIGYNAGYGTAGSNYVSVGYNARGLTNGVSIGYNSQAFGSRSISIGADATSTENNAITIGYGTNTGYATTAIGASVVSPDKAYQGTILGYGAGMASNSLCTMPVALGAYTRIDGSYAIGVGYVPDAVKSNAIAIGNTPRTSDSYQIAIGYQAGVETAPDAGSSYGNIYSIAIGYQARIVSSRSISIGPDSSCGAREGIALGYKAKTSNSNGNSPYDIAIGAETQADKGYGVAIGYNAQTTYEYAIAIGSQARGSFQNTIAIGHSAISSNQGNIAIGNGATSRADGAIAIGIGAIGGRIVDQANHGSQGIAIGYNSEVTGFCGIATGLQAKSYGDSSVAIGRSAIAHTHDSVALGYGAETYEAGAVQLGTGGNSAANTLKFRDYPLIDASGILDYERLSSDTPTHGYVLTYDAGDDRLIWAEGSGGGGYVLPPATTTTLGGIKVGQGLTITSDGTLSTSGGGAGGEGVWGQIAGNIDDQLDLKEKFDERTLIQKNPMPVASVKYANDLVQYTGQSELLYEKDFIYECQYRTLSSMTGSTSDSSRFGVSFETRRFEEYCKRYLNYTVLDEDDFRLGEYDGDGWELYKKSVGDTNYTYLAYITYNNISYTGINVQYYGSAEPEASDEIYAHYLSNTNPDAPTGYIWNRVNVQPHNDVVDNVTSTSTTDALSANQGRLLNERIDTLSSIGQFLAIWDCDTGTARYLNDGYQYTTGNYFIVGSQGTIDNTRSGTWSSEEITSTDNLEVTLDDITLFESKCGKVNRSVTFTVLASHNLKCSYDNATYTKMEAYNTFGVEISSKSQGDYTTGDQVIITYVAPITSYIPVGSEYDPVTGHETSTDDIQISDMFFYDGEHWNLIANHTQSIAIDNVIDYSSKNPVENRAIASALNQKVSITSNSNRLYGTSEYGQMNYELGDGLEFNEGKLKSTFNPDTKQDTLVDEGENQNIKTINGESLLGQGNIVIKGGSGDEGMGTLNIANVFHRVSDVAEESNVADNNEERYKGTSKHILFTTNADYDYLLNNKEDIYVGYSRRNTSNSHFRKYRLLNDRRMKINFKLYCWRYATYRKWDSDFNTFVNIDSSDWDNQKCDLYYEYFYTLSDYSNDPETMYNDNPLMYISDLRRQGLEKEDDNYSQGNWGSCLNTMYQNDFYVNDWYDYDLAIDEGRLERCTKYDIDEFAFDSSMLNNPKTDLPIIRKMVCQKYTNRDEENVYFWSNEWWNDGEVYAYLDGDDNIIANTVPTDRSLIVATGLYPNDLESQGYTFVEKRSDLNYYDLISKTDSNKKLFIDNVRSLSSHRSDGGDVRLGYSAIEIGSDRFGFSIDDEWTFFDYVGQNTGTYHFVYNSNDEWVMNGTTIGGYADLLNIGIEINEYDDIQEGDSFVVEVDNQYDHCQEFYVHDYPVQPVRLSECKVLFTSLPPHLPADPETGIYPNEIYEDYYLHAYTFDEIESNEDLKYMLSYQKELVFVYPYDTYHLWMRTFGFSSMVYNHESMESQQFKWHWNGDYPDYDYDKESMKIKEYYRLYAEPWDRHNLIRGMFLGGQRHLHCGPLNPQTENLSDFGNGMGIIPGTNNEPRWGMGNNSLYFLPVSLRLMKCDDIIQNAEGKSTPFHFKLSITGIGTQKILAGQ